MGPNCLQRLSADNSGNELKYIFNLNWSVPIPITGCSVNYNIMRYHLPLS